MAIAVLWLTASCHPVFAAVRLDIAFMVQDSRRVSRSKRYYHFVHNVQLAPLRGIAPTVNFTVPSEVRTFRRGSCRQGTARHYIRGEVATTSHFVPPICTVCLFIVVMGRVLFVAFRTVGFVTATPLIAEFRHHGVGYSVGKIL